MSTQSQSPLDIALDNLRDGFGQLAAPLHWPSLTNEQREAAFTDLDLWVTALVERFDVDTRTIPPCWAQHNALLEALSALRDYERGCYTEQASPTAAVDWLRALREIEDFCQQHSALTQCTIHKHRHTAGARWR